MIVNRTYYLVKPILPWRLRMALRRGRAAYKRKKYSDVWPIDPAAGSRPPGWPGWPGAKRFAVVLTHDVEGAKGLERVPQLMDLEAKYGFRSSFNFVPKWEYAVTDGLRRKLVDAGFEVGVHGLEHDGKLYASKADFARKAARIGEYLRSWNAAGFRSPMMQHRLNWLHLLGAEYDASTFDTDPFEPEPDGVGTIFPFWVPGPAGTGFVELPYTLVQDFSLFAVLGERTIEIWKRKTDWIAERGGMVLLNSHPDYMCFEGEPKRGEFPVRRYEELLVYLREAYADAFWAAIPREVARFYCSRLPPGARNTRKRVCILIHGRSQDDPRVRRYGRALTERGDRVDILSVAGLGLASSATVARRHHRIRYEVIHLHELPVRLAFAAWYPKWTGAKIIRDLPDLDSRAYTELIDAVSTERFEEPNAEVAAAVVPGLEAGATMLFKPLGNTNLQISEIGLGTWRYRAGAAPLRQGLDAGVRFIDTAESYGTESVVAQAIAGRRESVFLATKVSRDHFRPPDLLRAADQSLLRLGTDYIDLYQLHEPNPGIPAEETLGAMEELVAAGKVRFIGVSNFSLAQLRRAQRAMRRYTIVSNQVRFNLANRTILAHLLPYCQAHGVTIIAYSPLGRDFSSLLAFDPNAILMKLAGITGRTPAQIALNWCLCHDGVVAIPKSNSAEHLLENCRASDWRLEPGQFDELNRLVRYRRHSGFETFLRRRLPPGFKRALQRLAQLAPGGFDRRLN